MTRAQVDQLDTIPNGTEISVEMRNRAGLRVAEIKAGRFLQRPLKFSTCAWIVVSGSQSHIVIYQGDLVEIEPDKITVRQ